MMADERKKVTLTIDGIQVEAYEGEMVLEAARRAGIDIPTLCYHPAIGPIGSCRVCVVEIENGKGLPASCVTPVREGIVVRTNTDAVREARRTVVELILASHPQDCLSCERNGKCELQDLAMRLGIREARFRREKEHKESDTSSAALVRDMDKCILCGRCVSVCGEVQNVAALCLHTEAQCDGNNYGSERDWQIKVCIIADGARICPVGASTKKWQKVAELINDPDLHVVVQVAPAVRASIGEEFGIPAGTPVTGKLATALKRLGFDAVFDTQFTADLTIMEEGTELLERLKTKGPLPLITSCSPGWIRYAETFHPEFVPNLSSCKSPQQMMGAIITYTQRRTVLTDRSSVSKCRAQPRI